MKITKLKIKNWEGGYVLLETLFYIGLFVILSTAVMDAMITMTKAFKETTIQAQFIQGGNIMERMSREVRQSLDIISISGSSLKLDTKDEEGILEDKTIQFLLSETNVQLLESDIFIGNLNSPEIEVLALVFTPITTSKGKAVKISLTIKSKHDSLNRAQDFYDTVVLRESY